MVRLAASFVMSFVLIYVQSVLVMKLNHYTSIQFNNYTHLTVVWILNFFLIYSILTQLKPWLVQNQHLDTEPTKEE